MQLESIQQQQLTSSCVNFVSTLGNLCTVCTIYIRTVSSILSAFFPFPASLKSRCSQTIRSSRQIRRYLHNTATTFRQSGPDTLAIFPLGVPILSSFPSAPHANSPWVSEGLPFLCLVFLCIASLRPLTFSIILSADMLPDTCTGRQ